MSLLYAILIISACFQTVQNERPCSNHPQQLLDKSGKPVTLGAKEIKKRVVHCEVPKLPRLIDAQWSYNVVVLINPEGKVDCARALNGSEILKKIAEDTAKKWTFKPVENEGKAVAVYGVITIYVSWDEEYSKKTCKQ